MHDLSSQHAFVLIAKPAAERITVTDTKKQMRIEHSDDDALIEGLINLAFIWALHVKIGEHNTSIALPEAKITSDKLAHGHEIKDVKEALKSIVSTLDSIELALGER